MPTERSVYTPPQLAKERWFCTTMHVLAMIHSGRLRAFTLSPPGCRRPRWRIRLDAIREIEQGRPPEPEASKPSSARRLPKAAKSYV